MPLHYNLMPLHHNFMPLHYNYNKLIFISHLPTGFC